MNQFMQRLFVLAVVACFAIFIGVDVASDGIEAVNGPRLPEPAVQHKAAPQPQPEPQPVVQQTVKQPVAPAAVTASADVSTVNSGDSLVNRLADSTGSALRGTAQRGVEMVVSLFDQILD